MQLVLDGMPAPVADPEKERVIKVTVEIPYYGKQEQARQFLAERLPLILESGITSRACIISSSIR